jgi:hypothetical protein
VFLAAACPRSEPSWPLTAICSWLLFLAATALFVALQRDPFVHRTRIQENALTVGTTMSSESTPRLLLMHL